MFFGKFKHVDCTENAGFGRFYGMLSLICGRGGGAGQVIDLVDFRIDFQRRANIVIDECEGRIVQMRGDIFKSAGVIVISANNFMTFAQKP